MRCTTRARSSSPCLAPAPAVTRSRRLRLVEQGANLAGEPFSGDAVGDGGGHAIERRRIRAETNGGASLHGLHLNRCQSRIGIGKPALPAAPRRDRRDEGVDEAVHGSETPRCVHTERGRLGITRKLGPHMGEQIEFGVFGFEKGRVVVRFGERVQSRDLRRAVAHNMPVDSGGTALRIDQAFASPHKSHRDIESCIVEWGQRTQCPENSPRKRTKPCGQGNPHGCNRDLAIKN